MVQSSAAESIVRMVMVNSLALSLDGALLSNVAGDAVRPPGLMAGISPLTPTAGGGSTALIADLAALAGAVAPIGAMDLVFVASPPEAVKILLGAGPRFTFPVLASSALAAKTVICVAPIAIVAAADPQPTIQESRHVSVHMSDTPSDQTGGSPSPAVPIRSMFQTDSSAFRLVADIDWALLNSGAAAWAQNVTW
jgi:hypothetical protein